MPDFSLDEINLIFIYGNGKKKELIKQLEQMLEDAENDEEFSVMAKAVIEKVSGMTDQTFSKMSSDLIPDFERTSKKKTGRGVSAPAGISSLLCCQILCNGLKEGCAPYIQRGRIPNKRQHIIFGLAEING